MSYYLSLFSPSFSTPSPFPSLSACKQTSVLTLVQTSVLTNQVKTQGIRSLRDSIQPLAAYHVTLAVTVGTSSLCPDPGAHYKMELYRILSFISSLYFLLSLSVSLVHG